MSVYAKIINDKFVGTYDTNDDGSGDTFIDVTALQTSLKSTEHLAYIDSEMVAVTNSFVATPRYILLNNIKVTTKAGNAFDGDETSQDRMSKALLISTLTDDTETDWKLADNSIITISFDELKEALSLAIKEMSNIILKG